jgi:hypothetical protein
VLNEFYRVAFRKKVYRSIDSCRLISTSGFANTMRRDHIEAAGALAKHPCKTFHDTMPMTEEKMLAA